MFIAIFLIPVAYNVVETLVHRHDPPRPGAPGPGALKTSGDGEAQLPVSDPRRFRLTRGPKEPTDMYRWMLTTVSVLSLGCLYDGPGL